MQNSIYVSSEVGTLQRLLIHSPDSGLGKVVPSKAQDWLFEDIIHLDTMRRKEYDFYVKTLLYFLDSEKIKGKLSQIDADEERNFFKPDSPEYFNSDKVIELQKLLSCWASTESKAGHKSDHKAEPNPESKPEKLFRLKPAAAVSGALLRVLLSVLYPSAGALINPFKR